jgi:hypothetical protein
MAARELLKQRGAHTYIEDQKGSLASMDWTKPAVENERL